MSNLSDIRNLDDADARLHAIFNDGRACRCCPCHTSHDGGRGEACFSECAVIERNWPASECPEIIREREEANGELA